LILQVDIRTSASELSPSPTCSLWIGTTVYMAVFTLLFLTKLPV